jgi:RNA polymerase sigma-70 factor (ECF subfamily)
MDSNFQMHLIEKCKNNDSLAQMQLYDLYCKAMFTTAYNFIKDDNIAQDVMQEAFIKAFRKIETYTGEATFGAWLKRIVINQSLDWLKKKKLTTVELNEEVAYLPNDDPWEVDKDISLAVIYKCIESLPQKCKNVVKLYLLEGYDHQEVAQILEISEVASRSQLSRGKSKLKELLIHENYES